jgi:hypothetical protein
MEDYLRDSCDGLYLELNESHLQLKSVRAFLFFFVSHANKSIIISWDINLMAYWGQGVDLNVGACGSSIFVTDWWLHLSEEVAVLTLLQVLHLE